MNKTLHFIKHEISEAIAPTIFFLIAFHLVAFTKALFLDYYQISMIGSSIATIGALTVAKAILIMDGRKISHRFQKNALIWHVFWKSLLFSLVVMAFRLIEELIPLARENGGFAGGIAAMHSDFAWPHFVAIQIWLIVLVIFYTAARELDRTQGQGFLKKVFLHSSAKSEAPGPNVKHG